MIFGEFYNLIFMILYDNSLKNIDNEFLDLIAEICRKHPFAHLFFNMHLQKSFLYGDFNVGVMMP